VGVVKGRSSGPDPLQKRVSRLATQDLQEWLVPCVDGLWRAIDDYGKNKDLASLEEIQKGIGALAVVVEVLKSRTQQ
jgi:hypothetical protein